ncbi:MAG: hypothetical protein JWQ02_920, partial [Capsulimonas sp.]|nr:hypothetical protein [Capsulimonas sp.]
EPGATLTVTRNEGRIEARLTGSASGWRLRLMGIETVDNVEGGTCERSERGMLVIPDAGVDVLRVSV